MFSLFLLFCPIFARSPPLLIDPQSGHFVDASGRVVILHGVNIVRFAFSRPHNPQVYKVPPYFPPSDHFDPQLSLTDDDIAFLADDMGFNSVRLGVMWPGVAPQQDTINQTYLNEMHSIVERLGRKGIVTLVDAHQDLLTRKFCGEGVADWAAYVEEGIMPFPAPLSWDPLPTDKDGHPLLEACLKRSFGAYYLTQAVESVFQSLYENRNGMQDALAEYWTQVAKTFSDSPYVLGYELMNEPAFGDFFRHPELFIPPETNKKYLVPMYEYLAAAARKEDPDRPIFFEPTINTVIESGFEHVPGGAQYNNRSVFSYHVYCGTVDRSGNPRNIVECDLEMGYMFSLFQEEWRRIGGGGMLTEFGAVGNSESAEADLDFLGDACDEHLMSWSYWQFKTFNDLTTAGNAEGFYNGTTGKLEMNKVNALARTWARAVAGMPTSMSFDHHSGDFVLKYKMDTSIKASTEIFFSRRFHYPNGVKVKLTPSDAAKVVVSDHLVTITHLPQAKDGGMLSVELSHH